MGRAVFVWGMSKPKLNDSDYCRASQRLGCEPASIACVAEQESLGAGFDAQDRPVILFERHIFHRLTGGRFDRSHPGISNASPGGYGRSREQYGRFSEAFDLDPNAAMQAASWGKFQILGQNYRICGYASVGAFVDAMKESESAQLDAFCSFCLANGLDQYLTDHDWASFANGYNGHSYRKNAYDTKIAAGYKRWSRHDFGCSQDSTAAPFAVASTEADELSAPSNTDPVTDPTDTAIPTPSGVTTSTNENPSDPLSTPSPLSSDPQPSPGTDGKVAIEKEEKVSLWDKIKTKVYGWWGAIGGTAAISNYRDQISGLGIPTTFLKYAVYAVIIAFALWLLYECVIHIWQMIARRWLTTALIKANSTATNTVIVAKPEDLDNLKAQGWVVVTRGASS